MEDSAIVSRIVPRLTHLFPLGPVQQGSGLNITVMSVVDRLCLGALACADLVPNVQDIAAGFVDEIEKLSLARTQ